MSRIEVVTRPASVNGRLYPRYDEEAGILTVESRVFRPWPFGVDIDGNLVFDLDANCILAAFDLHIPRDKWKRDWTPIPLPTAREANLEFTGPTVKHKSFQIPISVRADPAGRQVEIRFGCQEPDEFIMLSESCYAILAARELVGFLISAGT